MQTDRQRADMASLPGVPGVSPARRRYDHVRRRRIPMPLFMDRHDVPGVTAEQVAEAHLADIDMGAKFGVQFLAYWFDADQGEAFCLAKAATGESLTAVHKATHGLIPNEIISVSEDNVLRLLGRMSETGGETRAVNPFRTILFTDLQGSTSILQAVGQAAFMVLLTEHDLIIRRALVASRGREVKHTGDGIMASFDEVASALQCSMTIQAGFEARAAEGQTPELRVRIGIAAGEPVDHNDDLFGSTVTLASRICDAADAGRILTSDLVRDLGIERGFAFDDGRELVLKGFSGSIRAFELAAREH
jgi:class 3 adenylate cyclase